MHSHLVAQILVHIQLGQGLFHFDARVRTKPYSGVGTYTIVFSRLVYQPCSASCTGLEDIFRTRVGPGSWVENGDNRGRGLGLAGRKEV